jgi:hypothetical protein
MTGPKITKRKRKRRNRDDDDSYQRPLHMFHDIGPPVAEADFRALIYGNPEQILATAFIKMKRDYGGPLPADFVLRAVLTAEA